MFNDLGFFYSGLDKILPNHYINEQYLFMFPHPIPPTPFRPPKGGYVGEQGHCILFFKTRKLRSQKHHLVKGKLHFPFFPTFCNNYIYYIENIKFSYNYSPRKAISAIGIAFYCLS